MATVREGDAKGRCEKEAALLLTPPLALSAVRRVWKQRRREAGGGQGEQRYGGKASRQRRLKGYIKQVWMKCEEVGAFCRFSCYLLRYGTIFWYQHSIFAAWDFCIVGERYKDGIHVMDAKFVHSCIISRLRHDNFNFSGFNRRLLVLIRCFTDFFCVCSDEAATDGIFFFVIAYGRYVPSLQLLLLSDSSSMVWNPSCLLVGKHFGEVKNVTMSENRWHFS